MRRTRQLALLAVMTVAVIAVTAMVVSMLMRPGGPFEGQRAIDLGTKEMHGEPVAWSGKFSLRNASDEAVHVIALRPNCGCVQVELPRTVIPAGESLEIPFTMTLERHGRRTAYIDVVLPDEQAVELRLDAEARETYRVTVAPIEVLLEGPGSQTVAVIVQVHDGENPPPVPAIEAPAGVKAEFTTWTELAPRQIQGEASRRWRGEIRVSIDTSAGEFSDGLMQVRIGLKDGAGVRLASMR